MNFFELINKIGRYEDLYNFFYVDPRNPNSLILAIPKGNVGIGTNNPQRNLHIYGANPRFMIEDSSGNTGRWEFLVNEETLYFRTWNADYTVVTERMTILGNGKVGIGTTKPITKLHLHGGALLFSGGAGHPYGSFYGHDLTWTQTSVVQNTWYNIVDSDISTGLLNLTVHDGSGKLTVTYAGVYKIDYSLTYECNIANKHVHIGIEINGSGSAEDAGIVHIETKFPSEEEATSGTALLSLAASATVELAIICLDVGTPTLKVKCVNLTIVQVGSV